MAYTHGESGYVSGCRCDTCRAGHRAYSRYWIRQLRAKVETGKVTVTHGTTVGYNRGCRCDGCRTAWAVWQRAYRARRKAQAV